jgi:flagellar protein FliO/FliZ
MFRFPERLSRSGRTHSRQYFRRAGMFAAGLALLWIALQLIPSTTGEPPVYSDESGSVAASKEALTTYEGPRLFSFGNVAALILLSGGGAFAYFAHKRSRGGGTVRSLIEPIGELGVGQGQQLRLVRCGGEVLLIGVTPNQITLLREFDPDTFDDSDTDSVDDALEGEPEVASSARRLRPAPVRSHFADVLRQYAGRYVNVQSNGTSC